MYVPILGGGFNRFLFLTPDLWENSLQFDDCRIFPKWAGEKPPPSIEIVPLKKGRHSFVNSGSRSLSTSKPPPFKVENVTISTGDYMFPRPWGASTR